jgi:hypothetical protein
VRAGLTLLQRSTALPRPRGAERADVTTR